MTDDLFEKGKADLIDMLDSFRLIKDKGQKRIFRAEIRALVYELTKN